MRNRINSTWTCFIYEQRSTSALNWNHCSVVLFTWCLTTHYKPIKWITCVYVLPFVCFDFLLWSPLTLIHSLSHSLGPCVCMCVCAQVHYVLWIEQERTIRCTAATFLIYSNIIQAMSCRLSFYIFIKCSTTRYCIRSTISNYSYSFALALCGRLDSLAIKWTE